MPFTQFLERRRIRHFSLKCPTSHPPIIYPPPSALIEDPPEETRRVFVLLGAHAAVALVWRTSTT